MRSPALALALLLAAGCGGAAPRDGAATPRPSARAEPPPVVAARRPPAWPGTLKDRCRRVEPLMRAAAARHGLDVGLIAGIIHVESAFRHDAVSRAGALGLMQVMPSNRKPLGCGDLFDPEANIECGVRVLLGFLKRYEDDLIYALSAYNAGWRTPNQARGAATLPRNVRYVEKVLAARSAYVRKGCQR